MNTQNDMVNLDALIQETIEADTEFNTSLESLSEEEKEKALADKRNEILTDEITKGRKNAELATNYKARAEKAEGELKKHPKATEVAPKTEKETNDDLTSRDVLAFTAAGITEQEDIDEVIKMSKGFGMSISDALKDDTVKHRLGVLAQQRKTAEATNTKVKHAGANKPNGSKLQKDLTEGKVPDKGSSDAEELFWARRGGRR